jgi:hypothetical protein
MPVDTQYGTRFDLGRDLAMDACVSRESVLRFPDTRKSGLERSAQADANLSYLIMSLIRSGLDGRMD